MKKTLSIFLAILMLFASVLAVIPASAATNNTEVSTFLPNGTLTALEQALKASTANLNAFADFAPYVYLNSAVNRKVSGGKLLSITIPVYKTEAADENGNFFFTVSVIKTAKINGIASESEIKTHKITIKGSDYGLTANTDAFKFIKVDLSALNITVGKDETLVFFDDADTLIPIWVSNASTQLYKAMESNAPEFKGFAARAGRQGYNPSNTAYIIFDLEIEKEKDLSAGELDFTNYATRRLLPENVYEGIKELYEKDGLATNDWAPSVAPFTPTNAAFQARFAGTRLRSITLPINKTLATDGNGDLIFTISTWKANKLTSADGKVSEWKIKIKPADYGLTANKSDIYKFIKIDISSYNIIVGTDEVLAFSANGDTVIPPYSGGANQYFKNNFPELVEFGSSTGKPEFTENIYPITIFFDIEYDIPASKSYGDLHKLYETVKIYEEADFTSGWAAFKSARDAAKAKLDSASPTSDLSAEYNALKSANDALTVNKNIDKSALTKALADAAAYESKEAQYLPDSWKAFSDALAAAKEVNSKADPKQSEINLVASTLNGAIAGLIEKGAIASLESKVAELENKYERDSYTSSSYKALSDALIDAKNLIVQGSAQKSQIDAAVKALDDAEKGLEKRADFAAMKELAEKYEDLSENEYHPDGLTALKEAIEAIKKASKGDNAVNVSEKEGEALLKALEDAIAGLKEYADFDDIDDKLITIESLKKSEYTEESWKALETVKAKIDELKKDREALNEDAVALLAELNAAVEGLEKIEKEADGEGSDEEQQSGEKSTSEGTDTVDGDKDGDEKTGCGSAIGATAVAMAAALALGGAVVLKKKD